MHTELFQGKDSKIEKAEFSQAHRKLVSDPRTHRGKPLGKITMQRFLDESSISFLERICSYAFIKNVIPDENVAGGSLLQQRPGKCV